MRTSYVYDYDLNHFVLNVLSHFSILKSHSPISVVNYKCFLSFVSVFKKFLLVAEPFLKILHAYMVLLQLCSSLCDPMDCSLPGSSVHEIFQAVLRHLSKAGQCQVWTDHRPRGF